MAERNGREPRLIYVTAGSVEEAKAIGRVLVDERLAACVNILPPILSLFRWEGAVREEAETAFLAKTSADRVAALTERVRALHSYSCPCVVALPIEGGNAAFLDWIVSETA